MTFAFSLLTCGCGGEGDPSLDDRGDKAEVDPAAAAAAAAAVAAAVAAEKCDATDRTSGFPSIVETLILASKPPRCSKYYLLLVYIFRVKL